MAVAVRLDPAPTARIQTQNHHCDTKENVHQATSLLVFCFVASTTIILRRHCRLSISSKDRKHLWDPIGKRCGSHRATILGRTYCLAQRSIVSNRHARDQTSR